jgi:3-methyladenine DNA glycosylase Tag
MRSYDEIFAIAADRHGGPKALEDSIARHQSKTAAELKAIPDDRWLSSMSQRVFSAGFNWQVIQNKWPGFEEAFHGFDVAWCAMMSDEDFDALLKDKRIVRNARKVDSVRRNAQFLKDIAAEQGGVGAYIAGWPDADYVGLLDVLAKRATGMGGNTAMMFLRFMGKPSFITSASVNAALIREGVIDKPPSAKRDYKAIQAAFDAWSKESGRDLTAISRTLAMSIDG